MHAGSLLRCVSAVDDHGRALRERRVLDGPSVTDRIDDAIDVLLDVAALLRSFVPFPPAPTDGNDRDAVERTDRMVARVFETVYGGETPSIEEVDEPAASAIRGSDRFEVAGTTVLVPLGRSGGRARNWRVLTAFLLEKVDGALETFRRVSARFPADRRAGCGSVVSMLETLRDVLERSRADDRLVGWYTRRIDRAPMTFAEWAAEQLGNDSHA